MGSVLEHFPNPVDLLLVIVGIALVPFTVVMVTCYTKIIIIFMLLRNALGLQNVPPTFALNGITIVLTVFIMAPIFRQSYMSLRQLDPAQDQRELLIQLEGVAQPFFSFLETHSKESDRAVLVSDTEAIWKGANLSPIGSKHPLILIPAFVTGELTRSFESGFLLFLPFLVIDLVVATCFTAMGMHMMQPTAVGLPLKILLFIEMDGWRLLLQGLIMSYA